MLDFGILFLLRFHRGDNIPGGVFGGVGLNWDLLTVDIVGQIGRIFGIVRNGFSARTASFRGNLKN